MIITAAAFQIQFATILIATGFAFVTTCWLVALGTAIARAVRK